MRTVLAVIFGLMLGREGFAAPQIVHFTPHALIPGESTVLTFRGLDIKTATNLWTSISGASARRLDSPSSDAVRFEVNCPRIEPRIFALQLSGPGGASDYQLIMADGLRPQSHEDKHQSASNACLVTIPGAVDCVLKPEHSDYYRIAARANDSISVEVIAHRMGSEMDPVVRVLDAAGHELVFCDDEPGVWRDARFVFRPPVDGDYLIEVHDAGYGGGPKFDYRLRVTREPLVWFTFPLADPAETVAAFEQVGTNQGSFGTPSPANPPDGPGVGTIPSQAESEPNDVPAQALPFSVPTLLHGRIQQAADVDYYRFAVMKDDRLIFQSQTRSLGSPCDLLLMIKDLEGKVVASSDPSRPTDATLTNTFPETGEYWLEVRELSANAAPNVPYRIRAARFQRGVSVSAETNHLEIRPGGNTNLKVDAVRYDYDGEVRLTLEPPIDGISLEGNVIPAAKKEVELVLKAAETCKPGELGHFKVSVHLGTNAPADFASTAPALRKTFPLLLNQPPALTGLFSLSIRN